MKKIVSALLATTMLVSASFSTAHAVTVYQDPDRSTYVDVLDFQSENGYTYAPKAGPDAGVIRLNGRDGAWMFGNLLPEGQALPYVNNLKAIQKAAKNEGTVLVASADNSVILPVPGIVREVAYQSGIDAHELMRMMSGMDGETWAEYTAQITKQLRLSDITDPDMKLPVESVKTIVVEKIVEKIVEVENHDEINRLTQLLSNINTAGTVDDILNAMTAASLDAAVAKLRPKLGHASYVVDIEVYTTTGVRIGDFIRTVDGDMLVDYDDHITLIVDINSLLTVDNPATILTKPAGITAAVTNTNDVSISVADGYTLFANGDIPVDANASVNPLAGIDVTVNGNDVTLAVASGYQLLTDAEAAALDLNATVNSVTGINTVINGNAVTVSFADGYGMINSGNTGLFDGNHGFTGSEFTPTTVAHTFSPTDDASIQVSLSSNIIRVGSDYLGPNNSYGISVGDYINVNGDIRLVTGSGNGFLLVGNQLTATVLTDSQITFDTITTGDYYTVGTNYYLWNGSNAINLGSSPLANLGEAAGALAFVAEHKLLDGTNPEIYASLTGEHKYVIAKADGTGYQVVSGPTNNPTIVPGQQGDYFTSGDNTYVFVNGGFVLGDETYTAPSSDISVTETVNGTTTTVSVNGTNIADYTGAAFAAYGDSVLQVNFRSSTLAEIENAVNQAIENAYNSGYEDGYDAGYADGFADGVASVVR